MYLIFDTETTGLPKNYNASVTDTDNWPRVVQIAWQLHDVSGRLLENRDFLIRPDGFNIPFDAERIHGISTDLAMQKGSGLTEVLALFNEVLKKSKFVVGHNVGFDINVLSCEYFRAGINTNLQELPVLDTCTEKTAVICEIPGGKGGKFKLPTLSELHRKLFQEDFKEAHNATSDVEVTTRCFLELVRQGNYSNKELECSDEEMAQFVAVNPNPFKLSGFKHLNLKEESQQIKKSLQKTPVDKKETAAPDALTEVGFVHLHNHSQFSVLQSTASISDLVAAAVRYKMPAVALTDLGNMMGAFLFAKEVQQHNAKAEVPLKPIIGCEFFVCENHRDRSHKDNGYQIVFLAKNKNGYHNLAKMTSRAYIDGFYYVPRIDKKLVEQYKNDLIVLSGGMFGEIPSKILNVGENQAEEALLWWKEQFGEDFYLELSRHDQENEKHVNEVLLAFSKKHGVKVVAANDNFYINQEEAESHDVLLCVKEGEKVHTPIGRGRGFRYGMPNHEYYFKSQEEMKTLFRDLPEAIINTLEIADKIEPYQLSRNVLLPKFQIPEEFQEAEDLKDEGKRGENAYLRFLTYEGAKRRYPELTDTIRERLDFELQVIEKTNYPGYFLIVEDFIREARNMGVSVGPGRGSAAGSAVAYCLAITNIDPIKYDLLFERFLNPDRVSLPDIDIDFDDEGRQSVIDYVIKKYGANQVAQIITYGTMAAKSSIRDTARVLDLPLSDADRIAKLIPNIKLKDIFDEDEKGKAKVQALRKDEIENVNQLKNLLAANGLESKTIRQAITLEGSLRNTGTHACGVIITPEDITNLIPVLTSRDTDMYITQYDNSVVEDAGLLKMDFLGLKTLTLIKDTVKIIKALHGLELDPDAFPLDDEKTYELFQRGETIGIFQYESPGMQKHLKALKPTEFADLIAMNALYRPGPMEYIPQFIDRKRGREEIRYDAPEMEEYLKETYGITVYQEQVMLLSQKLAGFTKGEADKLRKAMGKKIFSLLEELKPKFLKGGKKNNHAEEVLEKIWKDWEAFAAYAFNKSHSTCYAFIAYQTAYLKAHYPAEYMAAVLSNNMNDIKQVTFFMEECKRAGIRVLGPDINESYYKFAVNKEGAIRFGMGAIKGVGASAVEAIIDERKKNGPYKSIFDLAKRVDLHAANKKAFDSLILAGGFDSFESVHRAQYFEPDDKGLTIIEKALRFGNKFQENKNSAQVSLFGETSKVQFDEPQIPEAHPWTIMKKLSKEKEVIGMYVSGHPLDNFKTEISYFCNASLDKLQHINQLEGSDLTLAGIVSDVQHRVTKNGKGWATFVLEDFTDSYEFKIFNEEYLKFRHFFVPNAFLFIKLKMARSWADGDVRAQFISMNLLQDVMQQMAQKITVQVDISALEEKKIDQLKLLTKKHAGDKKLYFQVFDAEKNVKVTMASQSTKVAISKELLDELEAFDLQFKMN